MTLRSWALRALIGAGCLGNGLLACSSSNDRDQGSEPVADVGTLVLPLSTVAPSGNVYHLRGAVFEVRSVRDGQLEATLFGDDDFFASSLRVALDEGAYTVTLLPGWFIELEGGGSVFPPATSTVPTASPVMSAASPPRIVVDDVPIIGIPSSTPVTTAISVPTPVTATAAQTSAPNPMPTTAPSSVPGGSQINANLLSDAVQFVSLFANQESFVTYLFEVGNNVIPIGPGGLNIDIQVIENGVPPNGNECNDANLARRRSVFESDVAALSTISLRQVFDAISTNGGFSTPGETVYQEIIDSYASAANARLPNAVHCGDETTNGQPTLNGFPIRCDRREKDQFDNLDQWFATAFVNRIDLAPLNGAHCGQQRIVFANNVQGRMFMIVEAQIPNPAPQLGILGCAPLAQFWADLTQIPDATTRGFLLTQAFLSGIPQLQAAGFGPFYTASAFTVGSGQIRTNNFDDFIWTLREFKLADNNGELSALPFPVAEAPNGDLWNDTLSGPVGDQCRDAFVQALGQLTDTDDPAQMSFVVPQECKDAESENNGSQAYGFRLSEGSGAFTAQLDAALAGSGLDANQVASRAQFAGSCIGCHLEANGLDLGRGVSAPFSNGFVHVSEQFTEPCAFGGSCFSPSPGLKDSFLPHRIAVMENLVFVPPAVECGGQVPVDGGVTPPPFPSVSVFVDAGAAPDAGASLPPAPTFTVSLPAANAPTETLLELDQSARSVFGSQTLGGQDARNTH